MTSRKRKTPRETVKKFASETGLPGIPKIANTKRYCRLIWTLWLLLLTAVFVWQCSLLVIKFYSYPTNVQIKFGTEDFDFPAVTVCNLNSFRQSQLTESEGGQQLLNILNTAENDVAVPSSKESVTRNREAREAGDTATTPDKTSADFSTATPNNPSTTTSTPPPVFVVKPDKFYSDDYFSNPEPNVEEMPWYRKRTDPAFKALERMGRAVAKIPGYQQVKMSHQTTDFIQEIVYNGEVMSPGEMSAFTSPEFGVCHTFNAKTANRTVRGARKPGPAHGVSIVMFIEQEEYLGSLSPAAGVKVVIHDSDARPFPYEHGIDIAPGQLTSIGLRKTQFIREVPPYGTCTNGKDKPFKDRGLLYKVNYTAVACERSCLQYHTIDRCGCADVKTPAPAGTILCEEEQDACLEQVTKEYRDGALECDCPLPCKENVLQHSISVSQWPSINYLSQLSKSMVLRGGALKRAVETDGLGQNLLKTSIFFETLSFQTNLEERSYLFVNLLSDIGGQSGLWVGLSVFSGLEILEFFYVLAKCLLRLKQSDEDRDEGKVHPGDDEADTHLTSI